MSVIIVKNLLQERLVVACGFNSCDSRALKHRLNSCGIWAWLLPSVRDLPGSGIEPASPALAGGFFTSEPPGKHPLLVLYRAALSQSK